MCIFSAVVALTMIVVIGAMMTARRSGISLRAWLVFAAVPFVAPNFDRPGALERAIERDRANGPGHPPRTLLKRSDFRDELWGSDRCFRLSVRGGKRPLRFLYLHGGAYLLNVQPMQWTIAAGLLDRLGGEVIAPIYPLAPEHGWQDGLRSVERVYLNLIRVSRPENVVIFGDSAGGGLALALAQQLRDAGKALPAVLLLFSPWLDVGVTGRDQPALAARDPALSIEFLRKAGRLWAKGISAEDPRVSPLFGDHRRLPQTMIFSGTRDILDSDALRLARLNPAVEHRHYRNMIHVWPCAPIPEASQALDEAAAFVERALTSLDICR
jgi:acetyl esterase/lipase